MAVKNQLTKHSAYPATAFLQALADPAFAQTIQAEFISKTETPQGTTFRFEKKSDWKRWGRNFEITVMDRSDNSANIILLTQCRKVTVLWDIGWKEKVESIFNILEIMAKSNAK